MKTYIVTGAANGLGRQLSTQLIKRGHQVVMLDKNLKVLNALYDDMSTEFGTDLIALYPMDIMGADINDYIEWRENIARNYGHIDGIFLNAAHLSGFTPIEHTEFEEWYKSIQTNLNANFHLIQQAIQLMKPIKNGKIIAITDKTSKEKPAYYGPYGVAKAGLIQLMKTVSAEHCEQCLNGYIADLNPFASDTRGRLFPGENPTKITSAEEMACFVLDAILDNISSQTNASTISDLGVIEKV